MFDLSICQELFDRDPVRYISKNKAIRRGIGNELY